MSQNMNRRQVLAGGLGVVGLVGSRLLPNLAAAENPSVPPLPARSNEAPTAPVAIERCTSYDPALVRETLNAALSRIGGIGKLVQNKTVTVKVNMTGPVRDLGGLPASRTFHIHPSVVAALCAALADAGAKRIAIVEALYTKEPMEAILKQAGWDIKAVESAGGHKVVFENTKNRGTWRDYSRLKVPWGGYLFSAFDVNAWYEKTDVLISLSKLKQHGTAGVTMSCKNLFGVTPTSLYGDDAPNEDTVKARMAMLHMATRSVPDGVPGEIDRGIPRQPGYRVPRITADIVGARPIDLNIVDGVDTCRGGEGFWLKSVAPIQPKLLLAGRNPVCTDAICTAVMGLDPTAAYGKHPFQGENHLALLAEAGVGTNDPRRIEVLGLALKEAVVPFDVGGRTSRAGPTSCPFAGRHPYAGMYA